MTDQRTLEERNAEIVIAMWKGVIYEGQDEAVFQYIHPDYIQHT
jgi:predicted SnoaL-like aldol condensation-catalyzing enzyme